MAKKPIRREEVRRKLSTKHVIHYVNDETGLDVKCKEVFLKQKKIIHYPFNRDGKPKYKTVKHFLFTGFDDNRDLPVGISKSATYGLGFRSILAPIMEVILDKYKIQEVHVSKTGSTTLTKTKLTITEKTLQKLFPVFQNIVDKQKQDRLALASEELNKLFPNKIKKNKRKYVKNSVHVALESWSQLIDDFSEKDCDSIRELFDRLLLKDGFIKPEVLLKTKQKLDQQYIEDVIEGYKKLLKQKKETGNLEKRWQVFLGEHNWVFSYLFTFPVILAEQEAYVGGKNLSNQNGKVTDFLIQNSITDNVAFLEIKTHRTKLLGPLKAYRGNDVFSMSSDLSGGISQVLDQRDNFQKAYALLRVNSNESFDTINSKCVVLMGMLGDLNSKQTKSFELFRSNSKDVEIVCFDELLLRFEKLQELIRR